VGTNGTGANLTVVVLPVPISFQLPRSVPPALAVYLFVEGNQLVATFLAAVPYMGIGEEALCGMVDGVMREPFDRWEKQVPGASDGSVGLVRYIGYRRIAAAVHA